MLITLLQFIFKYFIDQNHVSMSQMEPFLFLLNTLQMFLIILLYKIMELILNYIKYYIINNNHLIFLHISNDFQFLIWYFLKYYKLLIFKNFLNIYYDAIFLVQVFYFVPITLQQYLHYHFINQDYDTNTQKELFHRMLKSLLLYYHILVFLLVYITILFKHVIY